MKIGLGALPLIMGNYARKYGIKLSIRGDGAWTDGNEINIPQLDETKGENLTLAFGYLGHETGHIRFTDFGVASSAGATKGTTFFSLANALEDSRIERLQVQSWPGMEDTFDRVLKHLRDGLFGTVFQAKRRGDLMTLVVLYSGLKAHEQWTTSPTLRGVRRAAQVGLRSMVPASVIKTIDRIINGVSFMDNTGEVVKVAEKLLKFIQKIIRKNNEELEKLRQQSQQSQGSSQGGYGQYPSQNGDPDQDSQSGDQSQAGDSDESQDGDQSQDGDSQDSGSGDQSHDGDQSQDDGSDGSQSQDGDSQDQGQNSQPPQAQANGSGQNTGDLFSDQPRAASPKKRPSMSRLMKEFELGDEATKELESDFEPLRKLSFNSRFCDRNIPSLERELHNCYMKSDSLCEGGSVTPGNPKPWGHGQALFQRVASGSFRVQVSDIMRAYDEWLNGTRDSGRILDVRAYANRVLNNFKVFKTKQIKQAVNTSVTLLVDCSGSMSEEDPEPRIRVAEECSMALAMGMEGCANLSREVVYFPGTRADFDDICTKEQSVRSRACYFAQPDHGGTPLAQALLHAVERLPEKNPLQRNIIIVLTDGDPDRREAARRVIERCTAYGIEVYAIGIGYQAKIALEKLPFLATETILQSTELPAAMKRLMKRALFRKNVCGDLAFVKREAQRMNRFGF